MSFCDVVIQEITYIDRVNQELKIKNEYNKLNIILSKMFSIYRKRFTEKEIRGNFITILYEALSSFEKNYEVNSVSEMISLLKEDNSNLNAYIYVVSELEMYKVLYPSVKRIRKMVDGKRKVIGYIDDNFSSYDSFSNTEVLYNIKVDEYSTYKSDDSFIKFLNTIDSKYKKWLFESYDKSNNYKEYKLYVDSYKTRKLRNLYLIYLIEAGELNDDDYRIRLLISLRSIIHNKITVDELINKLSNEGLIDLCDKYYGKITEIEKFRKLIIKDYNRLLKDKLKIRNLDDFLIEINEDDEDYKLYEINSNGLITIKNKL